jgi:hypothetical protein
MKWIIKYYLICIFLCAPFLIKAINIDSVFQDVDALFDDGKYFEAGLEYEYISYFTNQPEIKLLAQSKRIDCFTQDNKFKEAQHYAEKVSLIKASDSIAYDIRHKRVLNAYLAGDFSRGKSQYLQLKFFHPQKVNQSNVLYILILNELNEYQKAKQELHNWIKSTDITQQEKDSIDKLVDDIYSKKKISQNSSQLTEHDCFQRFSQVPDRFMQGIR